MIVNLPIIRTTITSVIVIISSISIIIEVFSIIMLYHNYTPCRVQVSRFRVQVHKNSNSSMMEDACRHEGAYRPSQYQRYRRRAWRLRDICITHGTMAGGSRLSAGGVTGMS